MKKNRGVKIESKSSNNSENDMNEIDPMQQNFVFDLRILRIYRKPTVNSYD